MTISKDDIAIARANLCERGKQAVEVIEKKLPHLKRCVEEGFFPIWIDEIEDQIQVLMLLAAKDVALQEIAAMASQKRRKK